MDTKVIAKTRVKTSTHSFGKIPGWEADKQDAFGLSSAHLSKAEDIWELMEMSFISLFAGVYNGEAQVNLL